MKKQWMAGALAAMLLLTGCRMTADEGQERAEVPELLEPVSVKTDSELVVRGDVSQMDIYDAEVAPYVEELEYPIEGTVLEVCVTLGQWVEAGDVLMRLDQRREEEQLEDMEESIAYTRKMNEYENRKKELDIQSAKIRLEQLMSQNAGRDAIELGRLAVREAETALRQQQELQELGLEQVLLQKQALQGRMGQDELIAPISGYVLFKDGMKTGSYVKDFETVMVIADPTRLCVQCDYVATSSYRGEYTRLTVLIDGYEFPVTQAEVSQDDYLGHVLLGKELKSRFEFEEGADLSGVREGMYAAVCYEYNRSPDTLFIPAQALLSDAEGQYVYVLDEDNQQHRRAVRIGQTNTRQVEILEGLEEGERVYVKN